MANTVRQHGAENCVRVEWRSGGEVSGVRCQAPSVGCQVKDTRWPVKGLVACGERLVY
jgi:hypothetical protein